MIIILKCYYQVSVVFYFWFAILLLQNCDLSAGKQDAKIMEQKQKDLQLQVIDLVKIWAEDLSEKLTNISTTLTREAQIKRSFKPLADHLVKKNGAELTENIAIKIRTMMDAKAEAVKRIAHYAEFLSYYRKNENITSNSTYNFFDSDEIKWTNEDPVRSEEIAEDIPQKECHWYCHQNDLAPLTHNMYTKEALRSLLKVSGSDNKLFSCNCGNLYEINRPNETYYRVPMKYDSWFEDKVNLNVSVVKVAINIFERAPEVLQGIKWSEPLDLVFKNNNLEDSELVWQYFASPLGFMRHYPAIKWSEEAYHQTYDFRTRSWYTEAMTSPKDIIILLDKSGSMRGTKRLLSHQIVNNILDTLNDNDFVNIYTFTNYTMPLVDCFNDTLFQANEENLRLLRENLPVYKLEYKADLTLGFDKAFEILKNFRKTGTSSKCNQAIMLITEGIDYYYDPQLFNKSNWMEDFPVRVFTYQIGSDENDAKQMMFIACSNMGYYVNMSLVPDIREKMLNYMNVMSRPINFACEEKRQVPIWSYLYADLADRRLSNWLWRKVEGNRQREVFMDHIKRNVFQTEAQFTSDSHLLLQDTHEYEQYKTQVQPYKHMTTVSLPVYGRRKDENELIGVAGIDVPIDLFKWKIPHDIIGVNGYAFIITNNGYILMHPDHRSEFEHRILKPTFNRVDLVETEILDDDNEPRLFGDSIIKLAQLGPVSKFARVLLQILQCEDSRNSAESYIFPHLTAVDPNDAQEEFREALRERMTNGEGSGRMELKVKFTLDNLRRVIKMKRHYYYTKMGPFKLGVALPDKYGHVQIVNKDVATTFSHRDYNIVDNLNWKVHPEWVYCVNCPKSITSVKEKFLHAFYNLKNRSPLFYKVISDFKATDWYDTPIENEKPYAGLIDKYYVHKVFLSTEAGLLKFWTFNTNIFESRNDIHVEERDDDKSIDEDWYQRAVHENYEDENMFTYSVPFEISGYENNTMIRATKAIFVEKNGLKAPVGVVGLDMNQQAVLKMYHTITSQCPTEKCRRRRITCKTDEYISCFILDDNAYIILSGDLEYTGRFIGDIRPDIMHNLVKEGIYEPTRMFDYQAICYYEPPEPAPSKKCPYKNSSRKLKTFYEMVFQNLTNIISWIFWSTLYFFHSVVGGPDYQSNKEYTLAFERIEVNKTFPTPCDQEMWLFNLNKTFVASDASNFQNDTIKFGCNWLYIARRIKNTNLLFLAINKCPIGSHSYSYSPEPAQVTYNVSLPCFIATMNNYTRRPYMNCYKRDKREDDLNKKSKFYCGKVWN